MCSLSEIDLFLMTGMAPRPAELILRVRKGREHPSHKGCVAKGYHQSPHQPASRRPFFFHLFNGVTIIASLMETRSHAS